jgi:hypothetical protein
MALDLPHHQYPAAAGGQVDQRLPLLEGGGDGLLHQHIPPCLQGEGGQPRVVARGRGDDQRIRGREQRLELQRRTAGLGRHPVGPGMVGVVNAGQRGARAGRELERVEAAEMPRAENADSEAHGPGA